MTYLSRSVARMIKEHMVARGIEWKSPFADQNTPSTSPATQLIGKDIAAGVTA